MTFPPISELIVHRGPSVLVDRVVAADAHGTCCAASVATGHLYEQAGAVPAIVVLEMMAQAVAAHVGLSGRDRGLSPRMGYLVSVRRLTLHVARIVIPAELTVHARFGAGRADGATFHCRVESSEGLRASAVLTVYQPEVTARGPEKA